MSILCCQKAFQIIQNLQHIFEHGFDPWCWCWCCDPQQSPGVTHVGAFPQSNHWPGLQWIHLSSLCSCVISDRPLVHCIRKRWQKARTGQDGDWVRLGSPRQDSDLQGQGSHYALDKALQKSNLDVNWRMVVWPGGGARARAGARAASMGGMCPRLLSPLARCTGAGPHLLPGGKVVGCKVHTWDWVILSIQRHLTRWPLDQMFQRDDA